MKIAIWLTPVSYFYNLPVIKYSIKGDNELRLYDILGLVFIYYFIKHFKLINFEINRILFFRKFYYFIIYCSISIVFTLLFAIFYKNRIIVFVQSVLYLYHMWFFYLSSIFLYFYVSTYNSYKKITRLIVILIIIESLIVILQNMGIIPFLFNNEYFISYRGFLSGTLGPNKIVIGMTMLISFIFVIGLLFEKRIINSKILLFVALFGSVISILLSGSRTTYVGLIVFLLYFFIKKTGKFISLGIIGGFMFVFLLSVNPQIFDRINDTINDRIVNKINGPEDINSAEDVIGVYDDLGAGRSNLQLRYIKFLLEKPFVIPFGVGFNNRLMIGNSAHNIYLSLINEVGLIGLFLFINWLFSYLIIGKNKYTFLKLALNGLVLSMGVTLLFGEHLYIYRPLFGIMGYFMIICVLLLVPQRKVKNGT